MPFVIIDNYDSFTYNLLDYLAVETGVVPDVVRNDDDVAFERLRCEVAEGRVDGIVISPGPGHPDVLRDFGNSAWALAQHDVPVLGICLGHQGMCSAAGAAIDLAPEPVHGRTSDVLHDGDPLFAGIPSPFQAMRYHSLLAYDIPTELEVTARTGDGLVMGVRHRTRPHWGVQFHPESIATDSGRRLIANFVALARAAGERAADGAAPSAPAAADATRPAPPVNPPHAVTATSYRLTVREVALSTDPVAVFDSLFADEQHAFWLDSARLVPGLSRFSMMGAASGPLGEHVSYEARARRVRVTSSADGRTVEHRDQDVLTYLEARTDERRVAPTGLPVDFALGYVGFLGYEALGLDDGVPSREAPTSADAAFVFADRGVLIDHETRRTYLLCLTTADQTENLAWLSAAARRISLAEVPEAPHPPEHWSRPEVRARHSDEEYVGLVQDCQEHIRHGESYEICLTNMFDVDCTIDPWSTYRRLRVVNPAPFGSYLRLGEDLAVLSSSPERFMSVSADGLAESKPIKGTRGRGRTDDDDVRAALALAADEKERAENLMIVDLVRNDLSRSCEVGSVHVPVLCGIESYETVHQMVSTVRGSVRADSGPVECVRHAFPGGSMTGAPKRRTMEIIEDLEGGPRGVYSGAIGYFSLDGAVDLSITIRTIVTAGRGVSVGAGGAITALSDPHAELREVWLKAGALLDCLGQEVAAGAARPAVGVPA